MDSIPNFEYNRVSPHDDNLEGFLMDTRDFESGGVTIDDYFADDFYEMRRSKYRADTINDSVTVDINGGISVDISVDSSKSSKQEVDIEQIYGGSNTLHASDN